MIKRDLNCDGQTCYEKSILTNSICEPLYNSTGHDYLSIMPIANTYLLIIAVILWSCVVLLSIMEMLQKCCKECCTRSKLTNFDDNLALGVAALIFSGGLFYLYHNKFIPTNFCVMNGNDPFCKDSDINSCFNKEDGSVFSDNFGFGGFIEMDSGFGFFFT